MAWEEEEHLMEMPWEAQAQKKNNHHSTFKNETIKEKKV